MPAPLSCCHRPSFLILCILPRPKFHLGLGDLCFNHHCEKEPAGGVSTRTPKTRTICLGRWTLSLPNRTTVPDSLPIPRYPVLGFLSSFHRILCCNQGQVHITQTFPVARLCPVATVTHETIVIVEEEAARNQSLLPREKDQDHLNQGKIN